MQMSYKMDKDFDNYIVGEEMVINSTTYNTNAPD